MITFNTDIPTDRGVVRAYKRHMGFDAGAHHEIKEACEVLSVWVLTTGNITRCFARVQIKLDTPHAEREELFAQMIAVAEERFNCKVID